MRKRHHHDDDKVQPLFQQLDSKERQKQLRDFRYELKDWRRKLRVNRRQAEAEVNKKLQELANGFMQNLTDLARAKASMLNGITTPADYRAFPGLTA